MNSRRPALYIVREREFIGMSKPLAYRGGKQIARYGPWKSIARCDTIAKACEERSRGNTGLRQRIVLHGGRMVVDASGARALVIYSPERACYLESAMRGSVPAGAVVWTTDLRKAGIIDGSIVNAWAYACGVVRRLGEGRVISYGTPTPLWDEEIASGS